MTLPRGMEMRLGRIQAILMSQYNNDADFYKKLYSVTDLKDFKDDVPEVPVAIPAENTPTVDQAKKKAIIVSSIIAGIILLLGLTAACFYFWTPKNSYMALRP